MNALKKFLAGAYQLILLACLLGGTTIYCYGMQVSPATATVNAPTASAIAPTCASAVPASSPSPSGSSAEVQAVAQISATAIKASQDSVDQIKWVFSVASVVVTGLLGVLAFLGFQNMKNVAEGVREEARRRVDEEITEAQKIISFATQIVSRTAAALRLVFLAEKWAEMPGNQQSCFKKAIAAIRDVRSAADSLKDETTSAWTHSFEAFCLRGLKDYPGAINAQLIALNQSDVDDPLDRYNAACYYALVGDSTAAASQLSTCIGSGGERFKTLARNDPDFDSIKGSPEIVQLIGEPRPVDPVETPDKTVPTLPTKPTAP